MKYIGSILAVFLAVYTARPLYAQAPIAGQWTLLLSGGAALPASASMHGTLDEMGQHIQGIIPPVTYPFGEKPGEQYHIGITTAYRLSESSWGLYGSLGVYTLSTGQKYSLFLYPTTTAFRLSYRLSITSLALGGQYSAGAPDDPFNVFLRLGLTANLISGAIMVNTIVPVRPALRGGLQAGTGVRYRPSAFPFGVEVSAGYTVANLIGQSYGEQITVSLPYGTVDSGSTMSLNDGRDASGAGGRTIDFVTLSAGIFLTM